MKIAYRSILYIAVGLIIILGLFVFLFRQSIQLKLHNQIDQPVLISLDKIKPNSREATDLEVLQSANFLMLKNNILNFKFDDICGQIARETAVNSGSSTRQISCFLGNGQPLVAKPK